MDKDNESMTQNSTQGFTLIELLAVIVILAVLMMTAIPAITNAINKSRKDTYATNAKKFIDAARTDIIDGDLYVKSGAEGTSSDQEAGTICQTPASGTYVAIPTDGITLERGGKTSSFGKDYDAGYVIIVNKSDSSKENDKFDYYYIGVDKGNNGVDEFILENNLNRSVVSSGGATKENIQKVGGTLTFGEKTYTLNAICAEE